MKLSSLSAGLLCLLAAGCAPGGSPNYTTCAEAVDPPECIVLLAEGEGILSHENFLEAVLRLGMVELALENPWKLGFAARMKLNTALWFPFDDEVPRPDWRFRDFSAAVVVLAAARNLEDPFEDPRIAKAVADRRAASVLALGLWDRVLEGGSGPDVQVKTPGLARLWSTASQGADPYDALTLSIARDLAFATDLDPLLESWFVAYAKNPGLSPNGKASLASVLARYFGRGEDAQRLLDSGGAAAPNYHIAGIRSEIAKTKLRAGPDAEALKIYVAELMAKLPKSGAFGASEAWDRDLLQRVGAENELRALAREYERLAPIADSPVEVSKFWAAASDCWRRIGDLDAARVAARKAVPPHPGKSDPTSFNGAAATGARALHRVGLIDEALATRRLFGYERYLDAPIAGFVPDPQWVLDEGRDSGVPFMVLQALRSKDPADRDRAYEAFRRACPLAAKPVCKTDYLALAAELAASVGDANGMRDYFVAQLRAEVPERDREFWIVRTALQWEHARELLTR